MAASIRRRLGLLFFASTTSALAACGARSELVEAEGDSGASQAEADATVDAASGMDAQTDTGSDAPTKDVEVVDAPLDSSDAANVASDASDASDAGDATNDASADASDASDETTNEGGLDAGADGGPVDGSADAPPDACAAQLHVDAVHGDDTSDGSSAAPYKTITKATAVAAADTCVRTISVSPGRYDAANGEVFPISIPANVALVGDEPNKGVASGTPTLVIGSALAYGPVLATLIPGSGATIAGLEITAPPATADAGAFYPMEILLHGATTNITVRNNTLAGSGTEIFYGSTGVYAVDSTDDIVVNNVVTGNAIGLYNGGGASLKIESNVVRNNQYGFEGDYSGADLGGGALGSAGLNILACNSQNVWLTASGLPAANNYWDHVPPTTTGGGGHADIYLSSYFVLTPPTTTGAMLASPNCP